MKTLGRSVRRQCLGVILTVSLAACGGGGDDGGGGPAPASNHKVSGAVTGLTTSGLVLSISAGNETTIVAIPANATSFEFPKRINHSQSYQVGVNAQPDGQACSVNNIIGTAMADVTNVNVSCSAAPKYTISSSAGPHGSVSPNGSTQASAGGSVRFTATPDPGYVVDSWQAGLGSAAGSNTGPNQYLVYNIQGDGGVRVTFRPVLLTANVSVLALSVNDPTSDAALSGTPRNIVITNTSSTTSATNVAVAMPALPSGTTSSSTCAATLLPGATCSITVIPGATSTAACPANYPVIEHITVSANEEAIPLKVGVVVLSYGCIYQGGRVFAIDDTTPETTSIGGKAAMLEDAASTMRWSPDDQLVGVVRNSVSPCVANADGACNSATILTHYAAYGTRYSAAGYCESLNSRPVAASSLQTGWYLPAFCEMNDCGAGQPSMQANLVVRNGLQLLSGQYWTSTEGASSPTTQAETASFPVPAATLSTALSKRETAHVRCARKLQ